MSHRLTQFLLGAFSCFSACLAPSLYASDIIHLGSRRELFVDSFLIAQMDGGHLKLHEPRREGVALKFDQPWEGGFSAYTTVIKDGDIYRMYYRGLPIATRDDSADAVTCYAESKDGITWNKPNLGLFVIHGLHENNVVLTNKPFAHNFSPFLDEGHDIPADERYKALAGLSPGGLHAFKSADGIRWKPIQDGPVFRKGMFDSQNVVFWSVSEEKYVCYFRTFKRWVTNRSVGFHEPQVKIFVSGATPSRWSSATHLQSTSTPAERIPIFARHRFISPWPSDFSPRKQRCLRKRRKRW